MLVIFNASGGFLWYHWQTCKVSREDDMGTNPWIQQVYVNFLHLLKMLVWMLPYHLQRIHVTTCVPYNNLFLRGTRL
jgi:hypothetical protein